MTTAKSKPASNRPAAKTKPAPVSTASLLNQFCLKIRGYILTDIEKFPNVPCWMIPKEAVEKWYATRSLGAGRKVSREKALRLIEALV